MFLTFAGIWSMLILTPSLQGQGLPYTFDFSSDPFQAGWTQVSVVGDQSWTYNANFNNASVSAFSGSCQPNEDWLITPGFDLSTSTDEILSFDLQKGFDGDNGIEILFSTDYPGIGDPNLHSWSSIDFISPAYFDDSGIPNNTSETFGPYDELQGLNTDGVYIAFKYVFQSGACATWRLAGFSFLSEGQPVILTSPSSLVDLNYEEGEGPSESKSYELSASNLSGDGNLIVIASEGFEISENNVDFQSSLELPLDGEGGISGQALTLHVRLVEGLAMGNYTGSIEHNGGGGSAQVALQGTVSGPPPPGSYLVDFEGPGETKTSYASGIVTLSGLDWNMTEALIGDLPNDFKNGERSARLRGYGSTEMFMTQDKTGGIGSISFLYARFGSDQQVAHKVEYSDNGGSSWTQIGDEFTGGATAQTFFESVEVPGNIRVRISTVSNSGTSNRRLNIDDILITNFEDDGSPFISAIPGSVSGLSYTVGEGPSEAASYSLSAINLEPEEGSISVNAPESFELSIDGDNWGSSLEIDYSEGGTELQFDEIMVRLAADLPVAEYGGSIEHSNGITALSLPVSGSVGEPGPDLNPTLFNLSSGNYELLAWDAANAAGSHPDHARFYWSLNPTMMGFDPFAEAPGLYDCAFNLGIRNRINGLGAEGFSFIATANAQWNNCSGGEADPERFVGSMAIGLNTLGVDEAHIAFTAKNVSAGERPFVIQLQYRIGGSGPYQTLEEALPFQSIFYSEGASEDYAVNFPAFLLNQEEVYLRFAYYQQGAGGGSRPELGLDDITICPCPATLSTEQAAEEAFALYPNPARDRISIYTGEAAGTTQIVITNIAGQVLLQQQATLDPGNSLELDLSALPQGMYLLVLNSTERTWTNRFVKH